MGVPIVLSTRIRLYVREELCLSPGLLTVVINAVKPGIGPSFRCIGPSNLM